MSEFSKALEREVQSTVTAAWESRDGKVVPESEDLKMANDRVILDAVLLYADLADSTETAVNKQEIAAEVFKSYLRGVTKIIEANGGAVRSFDGDRAMGVFIGDYKNSNAAKCGLQINWFFRTALVAQFRSVYTTSVQGFNFDQTVGIDRSLVHVARASVRDNNDLIWVAERRMLRQNSAAFETKNTKHSLLPASIRPSLLIQKSTEHPNEICGLL